MNRIYLLLAGLLALAIIACKDQAVSSVDLLDTPTVAGVPGELPIVEEPATLNIFRIKQPWIADYATNYTTLAYEKLTGVKVEWDQFSGSPSDITTKLNLLMGTGTNLPDALFASYLPPGPVHAWGDEGTVLPLEDLIEERGVGTKTALAFEDNVRGQMTSASGHIYALPLVSDCYHCDYSQRAWINQVWLDNLGLEYPNTTEEFYQVLKAFKEQDANGNGDPDDEIPYIATLAGWQSNLVEFLMNAFIIDTGQNKPTAPYLDGRTLRFAVQDPRYRDGLAWIYKLYSEGLIAKDTFTISGNELKQLTENPNGNRVGVSNGGSVGVFLNAAVDGARKEYIPLSPLEGPTGLRQSPKYLTQVYLQYAITKDAKDPKLAFSWADTLYLVSKEGFHEDFRPEWGEKGVDWNDADPGSTGLDGRPAVYKIMLALTEPNNKVWHTPMKVRGNEGKYGRFAQQKITDGSWEVETFLYNARHDYYEQYGREGVHVPPLAFTQDENEILSEISIAVDTQIKQNITDFIIGQRPLDEWDAFQEELKDLEIQEMLSMMQTAYDRQY